MMSEDVDNEFIEDNGLIEKVRIEMNKALMEKMENWFEVKYYGDRLGEKLEELWN